MSDPGPSMLAIHTTAIDHKVSIYHEFLVRYSKKASVVYGFVEGKTDPSFYRGFIEHSIPEDWEIELWPAGNKAAVLKIHKEIDWRRFPKNRVVFFVDRDLSDLLGEKNNTDRNIYVTDGYSIENDIVKRGTAKRTLQELFGFSHVDHGELDAVCNLFEDELERFLQSLIPIMSWILHWRRGGKPANLADIFMKHLFKIDSGRIQLLACPKGHPDVVHYIHCQCNVPLDHHAVAAKCDLDFKKTSVYRRFTRGKYLIWFLIEFCRSVHENAVTFFPKLKGSPQMNLSVSEGNAIQLVGARARIPRSLREFLNQTFCTYIESQDT